MNLHKVIAVCGKGGVGKTALTAMLTRELKNRKDTFLWSTRIPRSAFCTP